MAEMALVEREGMAWVVEAGMAAKEAVVEAIEAAEAEKGVEAHKAMNAPECTHRIGCGSCSHTC